MKNLMFKAVVVAVLLMTMVLGLVACKHNHKFVDGKCECGESDPSYTPAFDAAATISGYADKVEGTVKLTYVTNYKVDVVRPGADASGMASFKRDVVATTVVEMDLSDFYIKVTKTRQDKLIENEAIKTEELLFKDGGKYYYQSNTSVRVEVADGAAKFTEIFENATYEQVGGLTLDALVYNALDKGYELTVFGLSDTFLASELADPTYAAGENGGLKVTYAPDYVGYRTDGGWSDFPGADGAAANIEILTNNKGYVTSMKETYNNASLVFNIMSNPPTVTISGERSFTATYGEAITKATSVELDPSVAVYEAATNGSFVVKTCAHGAFNVMTDVANGGSLIMGNYICVKATPDAGYEIAKIIVNGSEETILPPASAGGFYCFNVAPGKNTIEVLFKAASAAVQTPTAVYGEATGGTFAVKTCAMGDFGNMADVANGGALVAGNILCIMPTPAEGYKVVKVIVNGDESPMLPPAGAGGFYCYSVAEGENKIQVIFAENDKEIATATYEAAEGGTFAVKTCKMGDFANMYDVNNEGALVVGNIICVKPVANDGYKVAKVIVNGSEATMIDPAQAGGFYCFAAVSGTNTIVVVFEAN